VTHHAGLAEAGESASPGPHAETVHVWDGLVRLVHWSVAILFVANMTVLEEGEILHRYAGYAILTLVSLRLAWGVVGTAHARFSAFPPSVTEAAAHLRALLSGRETHHLSHNPLGALMAYALWALLIAIALSGMATHTEILPGELGEEMHEILANLTLVLIVLHVAGVIFESWHSRQNLLRAMITGDKTTRSGA